MKTLLSRAIFGACLGAMSASTAIADEVILTHDKAFYSTFLQAVGDVCGFKEQAYTPPEQFKAFVQSSIASGQTPEMFTWWSGATFRDEMVATGQIAQLDDLWAELIANGSFTAASADPFTVDGHKYALPLAFNKWVMFYNPTLFAKACDGVAGLDASVAPVCASNKWTRSTFSRKDISSLSSTARGCCIRAVRAVS